MFELRWIYHDMKDGGPPKGAINVGGQDMFSPPLYQVLQYRTMLTVYGLNPAVSDLPSKQWSEWKNVSFGWLDKETK